MRNRALLCAAMVWATVTHAQTLPQQEKLTTTLQTLAKSKETEEQLKKRLNATERDMQVLRERAAQLAERLQVSERRVSTQEEALAQANSAYAEKRSEFEARKSDYTATVLSLLRMRSLPPTAIFSSSEDTLAVLRTASVLEKTNAAIAAKATRLRADMAQIKRLQSTVKARDASTRIEKESLKREQDALAIDLAARQKLQEKLSQDHERAEAKVAELSRQSQSLQELITKLAENEKAQERIQPPVTKAPNLREFDGKKGSARAPVSGEIIHRFGEKQASNGSYRGMVFKARAGAAVVAPYDGKVAFTGPFRDYGNMVLIKHKNGYISLIAGLGKVNTTLGQSAIRGEPIGVMPSSGSGEAYVELRDNDAKPIDPANWFANVIATTAQR